MSTTHDMQNDFVLLALENGSMVANDKRRVSYLLQAIESLPNNPDF